MKNYVIVHENPLDDDELPVLQWNFRVHSHYYGEQMRSQINGILLPGTGSCCSRWETKSLPEREEGPM